MPSFNKRNVFNRSHSVAFTCEMGKLVPFLCEEVIPGDDFRIDNYSFVRLAPMLAPVFAKINMWVHYFFVPNRLIWKNFEDFITNGLSSGVSTAVPPVVVVDTSKPEFQIGSLADYLGVPVADSLGLNGSSVVNPTGLEISALPFRACAKVFNDWYLPEFLKEEIPLSLEDGLDTTTTLALQNRSWPRDYYTSALPFTQLGPGASLSFSQNAPIVQGDWSNFVKIEMRGANGVSKPNSNNPVFSNSGGKLTFGDMSGSNIPNTNALGEATLSLEADLGKASAFSINDFWLAQALQRFMVRRMLNGNRYVEYLASSFGVRSPDARLQRAEFLGGGRTDVLVSEVLQTSSTDSTSPQGNMSGHGIGASKIPTINKAFTEHGFIIGFISIMPKTQYYQGLEPMWNRTDWTKYLQPDLSMLGEQAILNKELMARTDNNPNGVFGYQPRYEEYRRKLSRVAGDMRTNMDYWHMARGFETAEVPLNYDFVKSEPTKRIFAAEEQADRPCWIQMLIEEKVIRQLPKRVTPTMMGR